MNRKKTLLGLAGIVGIWLTAGIALPFVNILRAFTSEQLMFARGSMTALLALILVRGKIFPVNRHAFLTGLAFAGGCLGLYHGIRELGASLTIVIITAAPVVNFAIAWYKGRPVSRTAIVSLVIILVGITVALQPWSATTRLTTLGIFWSCFGTISGALFFEALVKAQAGRQLSIKEKFRLCFWQALVVGLVGLAGTLFSHTTTWVPNRANFTKILCFALIGGFLYFLSYIEAFAHLPIDAASVLAQGETPAVIIGAGFLLGERMSVSQWLGVALALYGTWYLAHWLQKKEKKELPKFAVD